MQQLKLSVYLLLFFLATGCGLLRENTIYEMENGRYKNTTTGKTQNVWAQFADTIVALYPLPYKNESQKTAPALFSFTEVSAPGSAFLKLKRSSFDIDVLTIPFKYRPSVKDFPNQLNASFSGAIYAGFRNDFYRFSYRSNDIGENRRKLNHLGISFGLFSGIGSAAINPWVTQDQVSSEYDGLLFMNGLAGMVAVKKITFGLGLGVDHLLDKNNNYWIYHHKPWLGLTIGLNLN